MRKYDQIELVRSTIHKEVANIFNDDRWGEIVEEDEFAHEAQGAAQGYVARHGRYYGSEYTHESWTATSKWRDEYIKCHGTTENR